MFVLVILEVVQLWVNAKARIIIISMAELGKRPWELKGDGFECPHGEYCHLG